MAGETYLTREGFEKLRQEMDKLQEEKRELSEMIGEAREQGDLRENAGYQYAKEKQAEVMRRIMELEQKLSKARLIEETLVAKDEIRIGAKVTVKELLSKKIFCYMLVGQEESDPANGKLSVHSPIGQVLLGHKVGEKVSVTLPTSKKEFEILKIER